MVEVVSGDIKITRTQVMYEGFESLDIEDCKELRVLTVRVTDTLLSHAPCVRLTYKQAAALMPHFKRILSEVNDG